ncbi:hypothetical protein HYU19_02645 [Candidatus Woesearchaeota archaeon]|nr:hypothetical protein [Candidatus Woesearchaeota archaeon]
MKCEICSGAIQETFLKKLIGTVVKDAKGKKHKICSQCQKKFPAKEEAIAKL